MNKEDLFRKIGAIMDDLNSQYEYLEMHPQQLSELELSLFQANADFLSNHIKVLMKISGEEPLPVELPEHIEPVIAEPEFINDSLPDKEPEPEAQEEELFKLDQSPSTFEFILNEHPEETHFEFEEKPVDELFNRPLSQEEENILAQKRKLNDLATAALPVQEDDDEIGPEPYLISPPIEELHQPAAAPSAAAAPPIEKAQQPAAPQSVETEIQPAETPAYQPTLNEMLATKADKNNIPAQRQPAITDLKQGINLNDKLLYIKDLFNGYNLAYAEAIELANRLPDFDAADNFFKKNYAEKNNWAEKQATVDKFYALLNRRFS